MAVRGNAIGVARKWEIVGLVLGALIMGVGTASAATVSWTNWTSKTSSTTAVGTISDFGGINVSYSGQIYNFGTSVSWTPDSTFNGGTTGNAPPNSYGSIGLTGGDTSMHTVIFSKAVVNPVMAIWSLGAGGTPASFVFDASEPFAILSGGPSTQYGGGTITASGTTVNGNEGNGVIQFNGTFTQLTWTNPQREGWYAFTVGTPAAVPVPAAVWLFGSGLLGLVGLGRRRR